MCILICVPLALFRVLLGIKCCLRDFIASLYPEDRKTPNNAQLSYTIYQHLFK
jgi:hypothetical protein